MARPKQVSDVQLLEAARRVFLEHGAKVPVATIARHLGVTATALFRRVGSKNQLMVQALQPPEPPAIGILKQGFRDDESADVQMSRVLMNMVGYLNTVIASEFCMRDAGVHTVAERVYINYPIKLRQAIAKWLQAGQKRGRVRAGNVKIMAEALLGTLEMRYTLAYLMHKSHSPASDRQFVTGLVREILRPK
jgi:AcrR family transcriptional regulator